MWYDNEVTQGILKKKYLHEGEETFEDLVNRVSSIYSEDIREDVKQAMLNADLSPAGRTLYAAGMKGKGRKLTGSNCFLGTASVLTIHGYKAIKDICVGDSVVTETGIYPVERLFKRKYSGKVIRIKSKTLLNDIVCTPNHKFLTKDGWKDASSIFIDSKDKIQYLKYNKGIDTSSYKIYGRIDMNSVVFGDDIKVEQDGNSLIYRRFVNDMGTKVWIRFGKPINRYISCDEDFRYFLGRWIGDGSITKRKGSNYYSILQIVFNATTERESADRIVAIGQRLFGITPVVVETSQNVIAVRFENPILGEYFEQNFGHGCEGKHLPDEFLGDYHILLGILDSDGCVTSSSTIQLVMKNLGIINWVRKTLFINGIFCIFCYGII